MKSRTYKIELTGATPLLMHNDNLSWSETMKKWELDPANKGNSTKGDDRSPAFRWIGNLYTEGGLVVLPSDNIMTVLREGGKRCSTGKGKQTFKAQTQSGIVVDQSAWPILIDGEPISVEPILALRGEADFEKHESAAASLGFSLFVKRARVNGSKHVRVRPRFDQWAAVGTVTVFDETITGDVLRNIITHAGAYAGVGDWRPSSPTAPGPFGKFTATVEEAK